MEGRLMGTSEVAKRLRVSVKTLRTTLKDEGLVPMHVGRKLAYTEAQIEGWLSDLRMKEEHALRAAGKVVELFTQKVRRELA